MSKRSIIALSPYCHFQNVYHRPSVLAPTDQPFGSVPERGQYRRHQPKDGIQLRGYATTRNHASSPSAFHGLPWPELPTPSSVPTPYEIFQLEKAAPYSKRRFYDLVKLYHPDRHGHSFNVAQIDCLSRTTKMKRYRLVVAANDILSDPSRRKAYDRYGAGWDGHRDIGRPAYNSGQATRQRWSGFHDNESPAANATWEDWERWYQRNSGGAQTPVYTSNGGFVTLVVFVVLLGAFSQASRVDEHQHYFASRMELVHNDCSKNIQQRKDGTRQLSSTEQAILRFMRSREQGDIRDIPESDDFGYD
ncbi:MAG: hypothetical protein Q9211_000384 [Gyalolechia sp. 1 TL-2023]